MAVLLLCMLTYGWRLRGETIEYADTGTMSRHAGSSPWRDMIDSPTGEAAISSRGEGSSEQAAGYKTAPGDLPQFTVQAKKGQKGAGYIFMAYFNYWEFKRSAYLLIVDNNAEAV